ncbi:hypothetical protein L596_021778 [Steinernema carpocapsae]|uniref:Uncharacterized protein n=1 Tax=Steinernema carpocapsae TaxID=34508 RepID=A0A4U5MK35_STECR|nr:hypothetical protein L596_021778 [Steinernema carpocapsae]
MCYMWFPQKKGFVRKLTDLPNSESSIEADWLLPVGSETKDCESLTFFPYFAVRNEDREKLHMDIACIADNWRPEISEQ